MTRHRMRVIPLTLIVVGASLGDVAWARQSERYVSASVDGTGGLRILTADGRVIAIAREDNEVGVDSIQVAPDGSAVGWVGLRDGCCAEYAIPTRLFIYSAGKKRKFAGMDLPVFRWMFMNEGARVAFYQDTIHGGFAMYHELADVATGTKIAEWQPAFGPDQQRLRVQNPPTWVQELNRQRPD